MPAGTRIERLFLSLGLDISEFDRDLAGATAHVRQATSQLSRELRMQRLRMDIELAGIDNAENSVRGLGVRLGHLNGQMETQRNSVALLNHAYQESVRQLGANAAASRNLQERLTREQLAEARLAQQIRQTNQARSERVSNNVGTGMDVTAMALAPIVVAGSGALHLAVEAVESENLWRESMGKMKTQGDEWSKDLRKNLGLNEFELRKSTGMLNTMFESMGMGTQKSYDLATGLVELGYDMASFYNLPTDQAFEKLKSGMTGEMEPLKALGILVDETTVKNYAYMNSIAQQGSELTAQQKVLARYGTIMDQTKRAQGDMARTLNDPSNAMRVLKSQVEQLGIEFGQTLIPTLRDFLSTGKSFIDWYNNADSANKNFANSMAKMSMEIGTATGALIALRAIGLYNPWVALATGIGVATHGITDYLNKRIQLKELEENRNLLERDPDKDNAKVRFNDSNGNYEKEVIRKNMVGQEYTAWEALKGEELADVNKRIGIAKAIKTRRAQLESIIEADTGKPLGKERIDEQIKDEFDEEYSTKKWKDNYQRDQDNAKRQAQIEAQLAAERLKINQDLSTDLYKLTHSDLDNKKREIDDKVTALRKAKADETNIVAWAEAAKAKLTKDANRELDDAIYKASHTAVQSKLRDIEIERLAWIKKTGDEVKATEVAEGKKLKVAQEQQQKRDALNSQILKLKDSPLQASMLDLQAESRELIKNENDKNQVVLLASLKRKKIIDDAEKDIAQKRKDALNEYTEAFKQSQEKIKSYLSGTYGSEIEAIKKGLKSGQSEGQMESMLTKMLENRKRDEELSAKAMALVGRNVSVPNFDDGSDKYRQQMDGINKQEQDLKLARNMDITDIDASKITVPIVNAINAKDADFNAYIKSLYTDLKPANLDSSNIDQRNMALLSDNTGLSKLAQALANVNNTNNISKTANNTITVNVELNATVNNDTDVNILADKVADKIKTPIINALAGDDNSY